MRKTLMLFSCGLIAMGGLIISQPVIAAEGGVPILKPPFTLKETILDAVS